MQAGITLDAVKPTEFYGSSGCVFYRGAVVRIFLLILSGLLVCATAFADCGLVPDRVVDAKIDKISAPVFDAEYKPQKGCLLSSGGEVLGYATEDNLCHLTPGKTVKVRLSQDGCCDTGPGPGGDFTCVLRAWSLSGMVYGNGVDVETVAP